MFVSSGVWGGGHRHQQMLAWLTPGRPASGLPMVSVDLESRSVLVKPFSLAVCIIPQDPTGRLVASLDQFELDKNTFSQGMVVETFGGGLCRFQGLCPSGVD